MIERALLYNLALLTVPALTHGLGWHYTPWLLDPPRRIQSGYDVSDPRVKQMMEALIEIQLPGRWGRLPRPVNWRA